MGNSDDVSYGWKMLTVIATFALMTFGALFLGARWNHR